MAEERTRSRRRPAEIRALLLEAASRSFAQGGYAGTSTRAIAAQAGVSETLLFRHFGTKAKLFEVTVLETVRSAVEQHVAQWRERTPAPDGSEYLAGVVEMLRKHRELILALMTVHADESGLESLESAFGRLFEVLLSVMRDQLLVQPGGQLRAGVDERLTPPVVMAVLLSVGVLDSWLFPPNGGRPDDAAVLAEASSFVVHGVAHRTTG